jgi:DNA-binding NtrC family response regulator
MVTREHVETVLARVRPFLQAEGGDIERIAQTCTCGTVRVGCVSAGILFRAGAQPLEPIAPTPRAAGRLKAAGPTMAPPDRAAPIALDDRIREFESNLISWALKVSKGNKSRAAELLPVKRSTLGDRIARCGLAESNADLVNQS